ncbi:MAG: sigma 54-interacting transcriptional regulator, partial [Bdellovibrionales bacterium]|nr:sigma 54-interacting transcriptional regulator [Bdellovibrionales bacterium]
MSPSKARSPRQDPLGSAVASVEAALSEALRLARDTSAESQTLSRLGSIVEGHRALGRRVFELARASFAKLKLGARRGSGIFPSAESFTLLDYPTRTSSVREAVELATPFSYSPMPLLISGCSGSGKTVFARTVHNSDHELGDPFNVFDARLHSPEEMLEVLFGTGKKGGGLIHQSKGGTIFFKAVERIPEQLQLRLGSLITGGSDLDSEVRVLASTEEDINRLHLLGKLRDELYYPLSIVTINLPTLNERIADLDIISGIMLKSICDKLCIETARLEKDALEKLISHNWRGNLRELYAVLNVAAIKSGGAVIAAEMLPIEAEPRKERSYESHFVDEPSVGTEEQPDVVIEDLSGMQIGEEGELQIDVPEGEQFTRGEN